MNVKKVAWLSLMVPLILAGALSVYSQATSEYDLKSSIIYRICKHTKWPTPPDESKPFIISILGKIPGGAEIKIPPELTMDKRKIRVRKITQLTEINGSSVLFIASSEAPRLADILEYTHGKPILTVGDTRGFAQRGVMINFYIQNDMVRFEINYEAGKDASLQLHFQLSSIGKVVKTRKSPEKDGEG